QLRKAASSLLQRGLHSPTPDVVDQLRQLHPPPSDQALPLCPEHAPLPSFTPASVLTLIRTRSSRGTAPGLSGWTDLLFLPLAEDPVLLPALTVFLEDIACGRLDESARIRLISCRLLPARKKD